MTRTRQTNSKEGNEAGHGNPLGTIATSGELAERLRPWLLAAATALWVARPLFPSEAAATYGDGLPVVMLWLVLAACWAAGAVASRRFSLRFGPVDAVAGLLVGLVALASLWAARHASPRPAVNMLWEWTGLGLGFFLTRQLLGGPRQTRAMIAAMIGLAAALSGYGLYQRAVEMPRSEAEYRADPERAMRAAGVWAPPGSPRWQHFEDRVKNREPIATFALTNSLAAMLTPWLVLAAGIAMSCPSLRKAAPSVACALVIAACLVLTESRSSFVAVLAGLALAWLVRSGKRMGLGWKLPAAIALAAVILVAGAWAVGLPPGVLAARAAKSFGYRLQYWQSTLRMIADRPGLGCGPGNFQDTYTAYKLPEASEEVTDPHNFFLEVWATAGTPAMLALVAMLASFAWAVRRLALLQEGDSPIFVRPCFAWYPKLGQSPGYWNDGGAADAAVPVFAGLLAGIVLAVPLGQIGAAPPSLAATLLGLPLAAGCLMVLVPWVQDGRLPPLLPAIGVAVMLVNLLAAGGIGQPGVAGSFWLLLALALAGQGLRVLPRPAAAVMLLCAIALTAACFLSGYRPVLQSQARLRAADLALFEGRQTDAQQDFDAAAQADPLAAEPWRQLAGLSFQQLQDQPSTENFRRFATCMARALARAPRAAPLWLVAGDRYFAAFARSGLADDRSQALDAYRRAVELYPNSALCHAKLAVALRKTGPQAEFHREAATAIRLDNLNPHEENKLGKIAPGLSEQLTDGS